jgi:hypothetical protein
MRACVDSLCQAPVWSCALGCVRYCDYVVSLFEHDLNVSVEGLRTPDKCLQHSLLSTFKAQCAPFPTCRVGHDW